MWSRIHVGCKVLEVIEMNAGNQRPKKLDCGMLHYCTVVTFASLPNPANSDPEGSASLSTSSALSLASTAATRTGSNVS
jgi:hypothetical protein